MYKVQYITVYIFGTLLKSHIEVIVQKWLNFIRNNASPSIKLCSDLDKLMNVCRLMYFIIHFNEMIGSIVIIKQ